MRVGRRVPGIALVALVAAAAGCASAPGGDVPPGSDWELAFGDASRADVPATHDVRADGAVPGDPGTSDDTGGNIVVAVDNGWTGGDDGDAGPDAGGGLLCSPRTRYVYVVTDTDEFLSFDPASGQFESVGTLDCPGTSWDSPFSMAIDRQAVAWVLYDSGDLFRVSTADASCEAAASWSSGQSGFTKFGMGFSSDAVGSSDETLFVSELVDDGDSARLATIAFPSMLLSPVGSAIAAGSGELTGNGNAELWGFFPQTSPRLVARIDKANASLLDQFPVPTSILSPYDDVTAWAFAFWGGWFFVFVALDGGDSEVIRLDPVSGMFDVVNEDAGYAIVGAGVSSCAPTHVD